MLELAEKWFTARSPGRSRRNGADSPEQMPDQARRGGGAHGMPTSTVTMLASPIMCARTQPELLHGDTVSDLLSGGDSGAASIITILSRA